MNWIATVHRAVPMGRGLVPRPIRKTVLPGVLALTDEEGPLLVGQGENPGRAGSAWSPPEALLIEERNASGQVTKHPLG